MNGTTVLYNKIALLNNLTSDWESESITYRNLDSLINDNLDKFFSVSDEFEKKEKIEILLNFRERIIQKLDSSAGDILALAISGIVHEVFKEGKHSIEKPPEIIDQITYHVLTDNFFELDKIFIKDTEDILITDKFKKNLDNAIIRLIDEDKISLMRFGLENVSEAVEFLIDYRDQLSNANLSHYYCLDPLLLEKLRLGCPNLKRLNLSQCFISSEMAKILEKMTSLTHLDISQNLQDPHEDVWSSLKKLTSLRHLNIDNTCILENDRRSISLKNLSIAIEQMNDLESLVIPSYSTHNENEINELVLTLEKLPALKIILSSDKILLNKLTEKIKIKIKVETIISST